MDALLTRRSNLKRRLTRINKKIDNHGDEPLDTYDVELLCEQLDEAWTDFNELSDDIMNLCDDDEHEEHENALTELSERIYVLKKSMKVIFSSLAKKNRSSQDGEDEVVPFTYGKMNVKLPKLDLPTFSGNYLEWTQFQDLFESSVHKQNLSGAQKLQYLKGCLRGAAADLISGYQISDASYQEAYDVLKKRYQNTRELVKSQIGKFNSQPNIKEKDGNLLRKLVDTSTSCVLALKILGRTTTIDDDNDWLTFGIIDRLDPETRELWESKLGRNIMPKLKDLLDFLDERVSVLASSNSVPTIDKFKKKQLSAHQVSTDIQCPHCNKGNHFVYNCKDFCNLSVNDRRDFAKDKKLCFKCLKVGHNATQCKWTGSCQKCKKPHNTLMHIDFVPKVGIQKAGTENSSIVAHTAQNECLKQRALLSTAIVTIFDSSNISRDFRALMDPGADCSFISENAVQQLRLKKIKVDAEITGVGDESIGRAKSFVNLMLRSKNDESFSMQCIAYVLPKVTGILPKSKITKSETEHIRNLVLADPKFDEPGRTDLLIGADVYLHSLRTGRVTGNEDQLIAQETVWGFIIGGRYSESASNGLSIHHSISDVDASLRRFWEVEEVPKKTFLTKEEQLCENHFVTTHSRNSEGRYIVRLPFRIEVPELG